MRRFAESAIATACEAPQIVWYIDQDDGPSVAMGDELDVGPLVIGQRIVLSECWNRCANAADGEILGLMGDDIVFRTEAWDVAVVDAFARVPDRILYVHGRDGAHDSVFGTHGWLHREWVDVVGYFVPPYFASEWVDAWLNDVANALGRREYLPDVLAEHMHPDFGKAELDLTHRERIARAQRDDVMALYHSDEMQARRRMDVQKLSAALR